MEKREIQQERMIWKSAGDALNLFLSTDLGMSERKQYEVEKTTTSSQ